MRRTKRLIINTAAVLLGLTSGAMLLIGTSLIPYWENLPAAAYRTTFGAMDLGRTMLVLGGSAFLVTFAALVLVVREPSARRKWIALAAICWAIPSLAYPFIYEPLNLRIAGAATLSPAEVMALLHRWRILHWLRIAFGLTSFVSMIAAINADAHQPK
jgi:hypothetical protein